MQLLVIYLICCFIQIVVTFGLLNGSVRAIDRYYLAESKKIDGVGWTIVLFASVFPVAGPLGLLIGAMLAGWIGFSLKNGS